MYLKLYSFNNIFSFEHFSWLWFPYKETKNEIYIAKSLFIKLTEFIRNREMWMQKELRMSRNVLLDDPEKQWTLVYNQDGQIGNNNW